MMFLWGSYSFLLLICLFPTLHTCFQGILAVKHGLDTFEKLGISPEWTSQHVFDLASQLNQRLGDLKYPSGEPVAVIYSDFSEGTTSEETQGGIVAFNLLDSSGNHLGYSAFKSLAKMRGVTLRTGCFCNLGGCQRHLGLKDEEILEFHRLGHKCGSPAHDILKGKVTGAVRASFGPYSNIQG